MKATIIGLISLFTMISTSACSNDLLRFDEIPIDSPHNNDFHSDVMSPDIYIIPDVDTPLPDTINEQFWKQALKSVDLSRYFVVFVFRGTGYSTDDIIKVINVRQDDDTVIVTAGFYTLPSRVIAGEIVTPAQAIKVNKSRLHSFEQFTFKLVDTKGAERASTTATIPSP
jgi:hypothetical protein